MKPYNYEVSVKEKCKELKCNQGDINSLNIKKINESNDDIETIHKEYEKYEKEKFGCLMLSFQHDKKLKKFIEKILSKVDKKDIIENEDFTHCTVLYGIHHNKENVYKMKDMVDEYIDKEIKVKITGISFFKSDKQYVLKFSVESKDLSQLNKQLTNSLDYTTNYPNYQAHITIAYLKPLEKYDNLEKKLEIDLKSNIFVYGYNDVKYKI